nr:1-acyl-sn-glycerol-3-phosphate acyltransferase-like [Ipomoea batatas]
MGTFMRSRRFGSYFDAWSGLDLGAQSQVVVKGELEGKKQKTRDNVLWKMMGGCRIRQGNIYGHVTGRMLMWILGNPIRIEGAEYSNEKAIYICNHASPIDIFLIMWLTPTGTVGIAKKEIIFYPLFGQLYVLANHLRIDRSNPAAAIESMKEGFVHMALQSRRPIVPIIFTGTHMAWRKGSLHVRPAPLTVKYSSFSRQSEPMTGQLTKPRSM